MFTKTIYNYVCLLGILALLTTACQEDRDLETATSVPMVEQPDIAVENGLLHFKDQSVWATTIEQMQEAEDYGEYVATLGFDNSLRAKYDAIEESGEILDDYLQKGKLPEIQDDLFSSLLNEEAMVKIGQILYKVTNKYTFSAVDESGNMLKRFNESPTSLNKLSNVITFENIDHLAGKTMVVENEVDGKIITARFQGEQTYQVPNPDASDHRVLVGAWSKTYGLYASVGVKLIAERYHKGGIFGNSAWRNYDANYLFCYGKALTRLCKIASGCPSASYLEETGGAIKYNAHRVQKAVASGDSRTPAPRWFDTDHIDGTFRYRYASGQRVHETKFKFE